MPRLSGRRGRGGEPYLTIITGQAAAWATFWLTLPRTTPLRAPSPRVVRRCQQHGKLVYVTGLNEEGQAALDRGFSREK